MFWIEVMTMEEVNHFLLSLICFLVGYRIGQDRDRRKTDGVERNKDGHTDA